MAASRDDLAALDFANISPPEFSRLVKGLSGKEIDAMMTGEFRTRVLGAVFARMERQFRPESAGSLRALIRWKITGESDAVYETVIEDGTRTVREGRGEAEPRVSLVMGDAEFLKPVSGNGSPATMFMARRLKVAGDVGMATGLTRLFDIPKA
ncbi:SCP2 sterol-binding domain-containing protein [Streptomyces sp. GSL17-111]|uniref:SCP2 sterol-binding domain-containing protein n=1 Tax=Streptomyces sp. GSL17-111 TaxID=3121596 RepID=UPI0030F44EA1